jgi:hypothetical protein
LRRRPVGADFFCPLEPRRLRCSRKALASSRPDNCGLAARAVCASDMPALLMPALPRDDWARRRASAAALPGFWAIAGRAGRRMRGRATAAAGGVTDAWSPQSPLPPQPQPHPSLACVSGLTAAATCLAPGLVSGPRTRSVVLTASLPWVDMARRRSSEALRALLPALATAPPRTDVRELGAGAGAAVAEAVFAPDRLPSAALPPLDIALRLANASALPLFAFAVAAIVFPASINLYPRPRSRGLYVHRVDQLRPSWTTKHTPWLWA